LGCPYTYGYLGEGPLAPGQWDVVVMQKFFASAAAAVDRPTDDADVNTWIAWATNLVAKLNGTVMGD
jgi:hypothetical protein